MRVKTSKGEKDFRAVWFEEPSVVLIDQPKLPFKFAIRRFSSYMETAKAIKDMVVRGAPAIGATAGYATVQAALEFEGEGFDEFKAHMKSAAEHIKDARPTAIDLAHGADRVCTEMLKWGSVEKAKKVALKEAEQLADDYVGKCKKIGEHGAALIRNNSKVLTHCNAGWLATVDWGTALAPIYYASREGKNVFVWVDETRPRCQGARLTAWELAQEGIGHAIIADNAAGYYMQKGEVDLCIVGADRVAANGDVANKIGTYEKAVVAHENGIPFYVAIPRMTFDLDCKKGGDIPIETRPEGEVKKVWGKEGTVEVANPGSRARNPAFDVTPAKYVTGYITEIGVLKAKDLEKLR